MKKLVQSLLTLLLIAPLFSGCSGTSSPVPPAGAAPEHDTLVGAWRSQVRFGSGAFTEIKDLEFMLVFNAGGTLTESSSYDAAPPVPPAYGTWRKTGPHQFEAKYAFFITKAPASFDEIAKGNGWSPAGHGELSEKITLSDDAKSYASTIRYAAFDPNGKPAEGGGEGSVSARRMDF